MRQANRGVGLAHTIEPESDIGCETIAGSRKEADIELRPPRGWRVATNPASRCRVMIKHDIRDLPGWKEVPPDGVSPGLGEVIEIRKFVKMENKHWP